LTPGFLALSTMSRYLIQRLEENPKVDLHYQTEISGLHGAEHLEGRMPRYA
jgi:hypothetical protein